MSQIHILRQFLSRKQGELDQIKKRIKRNEKLVVKEEEHIGDLNEAKWVLSEASNLTQSVVKESIESLVTIAITSVWDRNYQFLCEFELKRNKPECLLRVQEGDQEPYLPEYDQGGSILDIISYALRIVLWSMEDPITMPVFYLDEPFKMVGSGTSEEVGRAIDMIKRTSKELGLQLIINTHEEEITAIADRGFTITHSGGCSVVESSVPSRKVGVLAGQPTGGSIPPLRSKKKRKLLNESKGRRRLMDERG